MNKKKIIIGARASKLAVKYAEITIKKIQKIYKGNLELKKITTKGDLILDRRTSEIGGKGEFVKNIENELLSKNIDIAVHSLKDIPCEDTPGLNIKSFLKRNFPNEVLISCENKTLENLKENAVIGTSSPRREFQIKLKRPDLKIKLIRGNIDSRIRMVNKKDYDAIIIAKAGLCALNMESFISQEFTCNELVPSAGQGIIALQTRDDDKYIHKILSEINDSESNLMANCERQVLKILNGDCNTAIGVNSQIKNQKLTLRGELFSINGENRYYSEETGDTKNYLEIANMVGNFLKYQSKGNYKI